MILHAQSVVSALNIGPIERRLYYIISDSETALAKQYPFALNKRFIQPFEHLKSLARLLFHVGGLGIDFERISINIVELGAHDLEQSLLHEVPLVVQGPKRGLVSLALAIDHLQIQPHFFESSHG